MGYIEKSAKIIGRISANGGDREVREKALWEELLDAVRKVTEDPRFSEMELDISLEH